MAAFGLREGRPPQTYGIGLKEVWEVDPARLRPGLVQHSVGWPLDAATYGGSFMYHMEPNRVLVGMVHIIYIHIHIYIYIYIYH